MAVLVFPPRKRRRVKRLAAGPAARVHVFPSARHRTAVDTVAKMMRSAAKRTGGDPLDAAEDALFDHLNVVWSLLEDRGVTEAEREAEVRDFAKAAWAIYQRDAIVWSPGDVAR